MTGKHKQTHEPTRSIELTETECKEILAALRDRHMVVVDDMWDTSDVRSTDYGESQLRAITSAAGKMWTDSTSRSVAQDAEHVLKDRTDHEVSELRKILRAAYRGTL